MERPEVIKALGKARSEKERVAILNRLWGREYRKTNPRKRSAKKSTKRRTKKSYRVYVGRIYQGSFPSYAEAYREAYSLGGSIRKGVKRGKRRVKKSAKRRTVKRSKHVTAKRRVIKRETLRRNPTRRCIIEALTLNGYTPKYFYWNDAAQSFTNKREHAAPYSSDKAARIEAKKLMARLPKTVRSLRVVPQ